MCVITRTSTKLCHALIFFLAPSVRFLFKRNSGEPSFGEKVLTANERIIIISRTGDHHIVRVSLPVYFLWQCVFLYVGSFKRALCGS